jgi:hypothetical protein
MTRTPGPQAAKKISPRHSSGTILASIVFAAMLAALVYRYWPGDERSIRRHLSNLAESLSLPGDEAEIQKLTRFAALREYFTADVQVIVGNRTIGSREAVFGVLQRVQPPPEGIHVELSDITVTLAEDRQTAVVTLTARVSRMDPTTGETIMDEDAISLSMVKRRDDWVIASAEAYPR